MSEEQPQVIVDARDAAESAGLVYVSDEQRGIRRERAGEGFNYRNPERRAGARTTGTLERIRKLADPAGLDRRVDLPRRRTATSRPPGATPAGRKQYRYHPRWREVRDETKYEHMLDVRAARCRRSASASTQRPGAAAACRARRCWPPSSTCSRPTLIRVGNEEYARQNKSYGLTTLRDRHVKVDGGELRFEFRGKSGKTWTAAS